MLADYHEDHLQDHEQEAASVGGAELGEQRVHDRHAAQADANHAAECQQRLHHGDKQVSTAIRWCQARVRTLAQAHFNRQEVK